MNYLLDSNILLYAKMSLMPEHLLVSKWLEDAVLDQNNTINICERVRVKCCGNEISRFPFLTSDLPISVWQFYLFQFFRMSYSSPTCLGSLQ